MDLLYQLPIHRSRRDSRHPILEPQAYPQFINRQAPSHRLFRYHLVRRKRVILPDPPQLGWHFIRLELMAHTCTALCRRRRAGRFRILRVLLRL